MEVQPIPPLISQMFLKKAGMFCSERLSTDIVYLNECIDLLIPTFNIEQISKEYEKIFGKESWKKVMLKRRKLVKRLAESKVFYDALSDQSFLKKYVGSTIEEKIQRTFKKFFLKTSSKIFLMQSDIYNLGVFLVTKSSIQRMQIKNEYFKNLEEREKEIKKIGSK